MENNGVIYEAIAKKPEVICWWSGGITSAVACLEAINIFGRENCICIWIDTMNEHEDTKRFKRDCEELYGMPIHTVKNEKYDSIQSIWRKYNSLNVANGAICSSELKRAVRLRIQALIPNALQVFGFDAVEKNRKTAMKKSYPEANPIFPLLDRHRPITKEQCFTIMQSFGVEPPAMYKLGFRNNNCFGTGCVQGGIGYWQKMQREYPNKFQGMAEMEHELTNAKGKPVTMLRDKAKLHKGKPLFLLPHPDYPEARHLAQKKPQQVKPALDCNGYCGIDLFSQDKHILNQEINRD